MNFDLVTNLESCYVEIPNILYYSHIPAAIISLILAIFVVYKNKDYVGRVLFILALSFSLWSLMNLVVWIGHDSRLIMFAWSFFGILSVAITLSSLYFVYVFFGKGDVSFPKKIIFGLILLPAILLTPTIYNLPGFDAVSCEAFENYYFTNYYYFGLLVIVWILILSFLRYLKASLDFRKQIIYLGVGIELFLLLFLMLGYFAALFNNFEIEQYGLFGMTFFMGVLAYMIVKFKVFDIKLIGAQALVVTQFILIASIFTFATSTVNRILVGITLLITSGAGWFLIQSVKREVKRKEELQIMSDKLARANDELRKLDNAKSEFISIASHQLRTPLTAIKGFISLLLEGSYGAVQPKVRDVLNKIYLSNERLIQLVEDLLNISRIESGRMEYKFMLSDIVKLVNDLQDTFVITAKNRGLSLTFATPKEEIPPIEIDQAKIREVVSNLIDNSLKYTQKGGVTVNITCNDDAVRVIVSDTGIGIPEENLPYLFSKFSRGKDTSRLHAEGTGLGLYVGKNLVEMHHGKIWAESDGPGRGSRFIMELPLRQPIDDNK